MSTSDLDRRVFRASPGHRRLAVGVTVAWLLFAGVLAAVWWPLELVHVFALLFGSLAIAEFVLSAWRWQLEVAPDQLQVTPTFGAPRRVPRERVVGVREQTARPPTIVVDDAEDVPLPAGHEHHVDELTGLLGSMAERDHADVGAPPGPWRTLEGLGNRPNATLRSYTHHPRLWLAIALLSGVSALMGVEAALRWSRGESFLAIYPAPTAQPPSMPATIVGAAVLGPLLHAALVALLRGFARLLGGDGSFRRLYAGYAVALLPAGLVLLPGWAGTLAVFWALFLVGVAVQESERVSWWRATSILLLALAVIPTVMVVVALLFGEPQGTAAASPQLVDPWAPGRV
jgi:hypothetical protein